MISKEFDFDKQYKKVWRILERTGKRLDELVLSQKETEKLFKETDKKFEGISEQFKKTEELFNKTDEEFKKRDEKRDEELEKIKKAIRGITDGWGRLTEGIAIECVEKAFSKIDISIIRTSPRVKSSLNGRNMELDLLSLANDKRLNKKLVLIVECKTYLRVSDIKEMIEEVGEFYDFFPEYKDRELIVGVAFMHAEGRAKQKAEQQGLYLLAMDEETMVLKNSANFRPMRWSYNSK